MPCSDVAELIEATLDNEDRLVSYRFIKKTCGRSVGQVDLVSRFAGMTDHQIIDFAPDDLVELEQPADEIEAFLILKHLFALKSALAAGTGIEAAGAEAACSIAEVRQEEDSLVLVARLSVDILTEKIQACGACKGCVSKR